MGWREHRRDLVLAVGLVTIACATVGLGLALQDRLGSDQDSTADWVTAAATIVALLAAVIAARYAAGALRVEQARDRAREDEARHAQATLVAAWIAGDYVWRGGEVTVTFGPEATTETQEDLPAVPESLPVTVRNASQLPVHRFRVDVYVRGIDQSGALRHAGSSRAIPIVLPETTLDHDAMTPALARSIRAALDDSPASRNGPSTLAIGYTFTDHAGVTWRLEPGNARPQERRPD